MITPSTFKTRYTAFASEADARVQLFIDEALPHLDEDRWGDLYDQGLSLLVAHNLSIENTMAGTGGGSDADLDSAGTTTVGSVTISKGTELAKAMVENEYLRTTYGQRYDQLRKVVGAGAVAL